MVDSSHLKLSFVIWFCWIIKNAFHKSIKLNLILNKEHSWILVISKLKPKRIPENSRNCKERCRVNQEVSIVEFLVAYPYLFRECVQERWGMSLCETAKTPTPSTPPQQTWKSRYFATQFNWQHTPLIGDNTYSSAYVLLYIVYMYIMYFDMVYPWRPQ